MIQMVQHLCKVQNKITGKIFIVAETRLSELPVDKAKKDVDSKSKGSSAGKSQSTTDTCEVLDKFSGVSLVGTRYVPLFDYFKDFSDVAFKVVADDYVTSDSGSGVVHCAPAFGEDDYRVCLSYQIITKGESLVVAVDDDGCFTDRIADFKGRYVKEAEKDIILAVKEMDRLVKSGSFTHSYPFCCRSDTPLIDRAVSSWFVAVEKLKDHLPENSRGTYWVSDFVKVKDLHRHKIDHITIPSKKHGVLRCVDDVFDCWFESGSAPHAYLHYPFENVQLFENNFPGHFVARGLDQTLGWFYTLMILSNSFFGKPGFKNLVCHGLVLAEDGKKMRKILNNYPPPMEVINDYGADALRLYIVNFIVLQAETLRFKKEGVYGVVKDVFLPWYNAYRFLVQNTKRLEVEGCAPFTPLDHATLQMSTNVLDQWINSATQSLFRFVRQEMDAYRLYTLRESNIENEMKESDKRRLKENWIPKNNKIKRLLENIKCLEKNFTNCKHQFVPRSIDRGS